MKRILRPRRSFLQSMLALGAAPAWCPSRFLGQEAPSGRITAGFIGTGSHGTHHNLPAYLRQKDVRVVMVCDVDREHRERALETVNRHYGDTDCTSTGDFRTLLERRDIDVVMISTPDHWHTLMSVMAMRAGKDVQCEKPTLTIDEGKILVREARRLERVFQTSTEDRSIPVYHRMAELVRNGRIGKLRRIDVILPRQPRGPGDPAPRPVPPGLDYDMWLGPAPEAPYTPERVHFNFRWIRDYSGGIICDWGTHLFDTAQWANDTERSGPVEVDGRGTHWEGGLYNTVKDYDVTFRYADGVEMTCRPGNPGIRFTGTEGWVGNTGWRGELQAGSAAIREAVVGKEEIRLFTEPAGEHRNFLDCVRSRRDPYFSVDIGHRVSTICHLANLSIRLGRPLRWDPRREEFPEDEEANRLRTRTMRPPWTLA